MKKIIILFLLQIPVLLAGKSLNEIIDEYFRYNNWGEAKSQLEIYIDSNASDPYAYSLYASVLNELNLHDEAIMAIRKAINYESSTEKKGIYYYRLGNLYYAKKLPDLSLQMYDKSTTYNGLIASPHYMKGLVHYENDRLEQCLTAWKKYIQLTDNLVKKDKIQKIINHFEQKILDDRLRAEEEERKRKELLDQLKSELADTTTDATTLKEYKVIEDTPDDEFFEELD